MFDRLIAISQLERQEIFRIKLKQIINTRILFGFGPVKQDFDFIICQISLRVIFDLWMFLSVWKKSVPEIKLALCTNISSYKLFSCFIILQSLRRFCKCFLKILAPFWLSFLNIFSRTFFFFFFLLLSHLILIYDSFRLKNAPQLQKHPVLCWHNIK